MSLLQSSLALCVASTLLTLAACSTQTAAAPPSSAPASSNVTPHVDPPSPAVTEVVTVENARGALEGTLTLPEGPAKRPVVVIAPGSGPHDRDGGPPRAYWHLTEELVARGIGTFRYDKAGIGRSAKALGAEADLVFEDAVEDLALFLRALRADARVSTITLVGYSEGSLVGMLAIERVPVDAFMSLAGAGRPVGDLLREQLTRALTDRALRADAMRIIEALERGERVADVPTALNPLFRSSVQGYLISWMRYDPAAVIQALPDLPIVIAQGTTDVQVAMTDAERLAGARQGARLVVLEGMNHALKAADATKASQDAAYTDGDLPVFAELVSEVEAFVPR